MIRKIFVIAALLLMIAGSAWAAGQKEGAEGEMKQKLIVGTSAGFRPFEYREMGKVTGFDIDMMYEIGQMLGMEVVIQDMDFDALIEAVSTGTIDVIAAGMTITEERKERVDFTDHYFIADQAVLVRKDSPLKIDAAENINKSSYKIGVQNDTTGAFWVEDNAPEAEIQKYGKYIECIQDLENKNIDMIVVDKPVAAAFEKNRNVKVAYVIKTDEKYGLAVKKGSELLNSINDALKKLMASPKWDELMKKYFGSE